MGKIVKTVVYIISLVFVFVISLFIFTPLINDYRLVLLRISLTLLYRSTMQIEQKTICGKLNKNGNVHGFFSMYINQI